MNDCGWCDGGVDEARQHEGVVVCGGFDCLSECGVCSL